MGDDFTVHLVSNVSPDTFPHNNPASFSTLLANDIDLNEGSWEVAVRQIMYPTHVATTNKTDDRIAFYEYEEYYRNLLPYPKSKDRNLKNVGATLSFNHLSSIARAFKSSSKESSIPSATTPLTSEMVVLTRHVLHTINVSKWSASQKILKMEYNDKLKKFILHVLHDDIVVLMSDPLAKALGFKSPAYSFGTHWAERAVSQFTNLPSSDMNMFIYDLQVLETEEHDLLMSVESTSKERMYQKVIPCKLLDTVSDNYYSEPTFSFCVYPHEKAIRIKTVFPIPEVHKKHESPLLFFRFDKKSIEKLNFNHIYCVRNGVEMWFNAPSKEVLEEVLNDVHSIGVQLYFASVRDISPTLKETSRVSFPIKTEKEIKTAKDFLAPLNVHSNTYKYKFTYDTTAKRYAIQTGSLYAMEISNNLASILGFSTTNRIYHQNTYTFADNVPVLHRAITALYVYTNIINGVYIGDVKAPLLLTCPFKQKNKQDIVHQMEFLNPTYVGLNRKTIQQINIDIYDDAGTMVPFLYGKTKLTLHFRQRKIV